MTEILVQVGTEERVPPAARVVEHPAWPVLKDAVEAIRPWQAKDGSIDFDAEGAPDPRRRRSRRTPVPSTPSSELAPLLPHDAAYHEALVEGPAPLGRRRLRACPTSSTRCWPSSPPRTARTASSTWSSSRCTPRTATRTATSKPSCCAWSGRTGWPSWSAPATTTRCSAASPSRTSPPGYDTNSAVLFPETIAVREAPERFTWGGIFCDREAARFRAVTEAAVDTLGLELPEDIAATGRRPGALRAGLRAVGHGPRPHPQPRRPALRPVHDQAAPAVLDVRPGGAALRPHRLQGGREAGGRGLPAGP